MSLRRWADNGWLRTHRTDREEIGNLLAVADRSLGDAGEDISPDGSFMMVYNAALNLCTILLYAEGYRPATASLRHYRTLAALPLVLGEGRNKDAEYLDACRMKRNRMEYDCAGLASRSESRELADFVGTLREEVIEWLKTNHPELVCR